MNDRNSEKNPRVVTLNHEDILLERPNVRITALAESFVELLRVPPSA
jgi:hypothetical protein